MLDQEWLVIPCMMVSFLIRVPIFIITFMIGSVVDAVRYGWDLSNFHQCE